MAACVGRNPEWWSDDRTMRPLAVQVCLGCPVRKPCLAEAVKGSDVGVVRGGMLITGTRARGRNFIDLVCAYCRSRPVTMTRTSQSADCPLCHEVLTRVR